MPAVTKKQTGDFGEAYTRDYLIKQGFSIVISNYKSRYGEIDIIAENTEFILFVEVKTRGEGSWYQPKEAVTPAKMNKIIKTAQMFLCENIVSLQPRFDVSEVFVKLHKNTLSVTDFHYITNAF